MTTEERQAISRASIEAHQAARDRAISEKIWVFDETLPATGLSGGAIVAPDGESIAYVFTYLDGWRDRVNALIESANRRGPKTTKAINKLEGIKFYIGSDDPGAHGDPGLVLYRTVTEEERAKAKAENEGEPWPNDPEPWSMWLTEDVLAVAEASGLLDENIGCSAAKAREWLQGDAKADQIRKKIAYLEGELTRLSGRPLLIRDGINGGTTYNDIPPGGALLDFETGIPEQQRTEWYPDLESAKAALAVLWHEHRGSLAKGGLYLDADPVVAYITRRDTAKGAGK